MQRFAETILLERLIYDRFFFLLFLIFAQSSKEESYFF